MSDVHLSDDNVHLSHANVHLCSSSSSSTFLRSKQHMRRGLVGRKEFGMTLTEEEEKHEKIIQE